MRIAILSRGDGWHVQDLLRAARDATVHADAVDFRLISSGNSDPLPSYDAALIRTMPAGSLEQVIFRMDVLHAFAQTRLVLNSPRAVETCVDKYLTNVRLIAAGLRVPRTIVCQTADTALSAFHELGRDVVVKPIFGAEGRGMVRISDVELAWRTFHAIEQTRGVVYVQEMIVHPGWDLRVFVIGTQIVGAMRRRNDRDWRTNIAQGGTAELYEVGAVEAELAIAAAEATGAVVAGVDLLPDGVGGWYVIEVNAVPGWRALGAVTGIDFASQIVAELVRRI